MIKFFRKIRQKLLSEGKTAKYLKYAFGEIILVVIGILIALTINNWNENRIAKKSEKGQLINLVQDLKLDSLHFDATLKRINTINALHKELHDIGLKGISKSISLNPGIVRWSFGLNPPSRKSITILINELGNKAVRNRIISYLDLLEFTEPDVKEFGSIIKDKIRVFIGQQGMYNVSQQFEDNSGVISAENLIALSKDKDFQQLLFEANLKLRGTKRRVSKLILENNLLTEKVKSELEKY
jgi:hypothetical protein